MAVAGREGGSERCVQGSTEHEAATIGARSVIQASRAQHRGRLNSPHISGSIWARLWAHTAPAPSSVGQRRRPATSAPHFTAPPSPQNHSAPHRSASAQAGIEKKERKGRGEKRERGKKDRDGVQPAAGQRGRGRGAGECRVLWLSPVTQQRQSPPFLHAAARALPATRQPALQCTRRSSITRDEGKRERTVKRKNDH